MEQSKEAQHFHFIDRRLFTRLYNGDLGPLIVTLKDGRQMVGEVKGIARRRQSDGTLMIGTISLVMANGEVELDYATISDIA